MFSFQNIGGDPKPLILAVLSLSSTRHDTKPHPMTSIMSLPWHWHQHSSSWNCFISLFFPCLIIQLNHMISPFQYQILWRRSRKLVVDMLFLLLWTIEFFFNLILFSLDCQLSSKCQSTYLCWYLVWSSKLMFWHSWKVLEYDGIKWHIVMSRMWHAPLLNLPMPRVEGCFIDARAHKVQRVDMFRILDDQIWIYFDTSQWFHIFMCTTYKLHNTNYIICIHIHTYIHTYIHTWYIHVHILTKGLI